MVPPPDAPARLAFNVAGSIVFLDVTARSDGDYGLTATASSISEGLAVLGTDLTIWGVPADPVHTPERHCPGEPILRLASQPPVAPARPPKPASGATPPAARTKTPVSPAPSASTPGSTPETSSLAPSTATSPTATPTPIRMGRPPGPHRLPQSPLRTDPAGNPDHRKAADSPSGLDVHIRIPQYCWQTKDALCQSDLRDAEVTLPKGMTLNPASASGLGACSAEIRSALATPVGSSSPIHFDESKANAGFRQDRERHDRHAAARPPRRGDRRAGPRPQRRPRPRAAARRRLSRQAVRQPLRLAAGDLPRRRRLRRRRQAGLRRDRHRPRRPLDHRLRRTSRRPPTASIQLELFGGLPGAALRTPLELWRPTPPSRSSPHGRATLPPSDSSVLRAEHDPIMNRPTHGAFDPKLTAGTTEPAGRRLQPLHPAPHPR